MKKAIKSTLAVVAGTAALAGVAAIPALVSAGGDSMGGRKEYTNAEINELYSKGQWDNKVVFNSIKDSEFGHEFNFVTARDDSTNEGENNVWKDAVPVEDGKTYLIRMYVHNNGKSEEDWRETGKGVAKNTRVFFNIPQAASTEVKVEGFITSDNAAPNEYWDDVVFKSTNG